MPTPAAELLLLLLFIDMTAYGPTLRPDITVMVDWALRINYLSIYPIFSGGGGVGKTWVT